MRVSFKNRTGYVEAMRGFHGNWIVIRGLFDDLCQVENIDWTVVTQYLSVPQICRLV